MISRTVDYYKPPWPWFENHEMLMPQKDIECLIGLARKSRPSSTQSAKIVEVGSFVGQAAAAIANAVPCWIVCVDHWQGDENSGDETSKRLIDDSDRHYKAYLKNTLPFPNIRHAKLPSVEAAELFADGFLDMVFIDASHEYEAVKADIAAWTPKIRSGGILCGHDFSEYEGVRRAVEEMGGYLLGSSEIWWRKV